MTEEEFQNNGFRKIRCMISLTLFNRIRKLGLLREDKFDSFVEHSLEQALAQRCQNCGSIICRDHDGKFYCHICHEFKGAPL